MFETACMLIPDERKALYASTAGYEVSHVMGQSNSFATETRSGL